MKKRLTEEEIAAKLAKQAACPHPRDRRGKDVCYGDICLVCLDCDYWEDIQNDQTLFSFERPVKPKWTSPLQLSVGFC